MSRGCRILAPVAIAVILAGCAKIEPASSVNGYVTDLPMSALEYQQFVTQEIAAVENVLITRVSMAKAVAEEAYDPAKEADSAREALTKVEAVLTELKGAMPAATYESDRQTTIDLVEDARLALSDYVDRLKAGDKAEISRSETELKQCFVALSGEVNTTYQ